MKSEHGNALLTWSKKPTVKKMYPKFESALKSFDEIIGLEDAKDHFYKKIKAIILLNLNIDVVEKSSGVVTRSSGVVSRSKKPRRKRQKRSENKISLGDIVQAIIVNRINEEAADDDDEDYDDNVAESEESEESEEEEERHNINLHLALLGPSGCGKTFMAKKIYKLYASLRLVKPGKFSVVTRSAMVDRYQGWTSKRTRKLIEAHRGGVLFIDEAYSLVNSSNDSFGREALAEIIESMTSGSTTFFFAGYAADTMRRLFGANEGLERRVNTVLNLTKPTYSDLFQIFIQQFKICEKRLRIRRDLHEEIKLLFRNNVKIFKNNGGDVVVLKDFIRSEAICRLWDNKPKKLKKFFSITIEDISKAMLAMKNMRDNVRSSRPIPSGMYI